MTKSFFNENWQELESQTGSEIISYVWGLRYIDDLVLREKGEERLYSLADLNWNVVAISDSTGDVVERMKYDAFGKVTWLDNNFNVKNSSDYNWNRTFTGQVLDIEVGLMLYRERYYEIQFGRFINRDPTGYEAEDVNLYRYVNNFPIIAKDQYGLDITVETGNDTWSPLNNAVHQNICVDVWAGCNTNSPRKLGKRCFSFGKCPKLEGLGVWGGSTWLGMDSCKACILTGIVYEADPVDTAGISRLKKTTCQEDRAFLEKLRSLENTKDGYSVANHNCRRFSQCMFEDAPGIEMKWVCLEYEYICYASSGGFAGCAKVCKRGEWQAIAK